MTFLSIKRTYKILRWKYMYVISLNLLKIYHIYTALNLKFKLIFNAKTILLFSSLKGFWNLTESVMNTYEQNYVTLLNNDIMKWKHISDILVSRKRIMGIFFRPCDWIERLYKVEIFKLSRIKTKFLICIICMHLYLCIYVWL